MKEKMEKVKAKIVIEDEGPGSWDIEPIEEEKKNPNADKLIILGFSPTSRHHAVKFLKDYPGCEMWCLNEFYVYGQEGFPVNLATRWFEIHNCKENPNVNPDGKQGQDHRAYLKQYPGKLYVQNKPEYWADFKNAIDFPVKEIIEFFPRRYFGSTPSWLMALAIKEGLEEYKKTGKFKWSKILIAGVDMQSGWNRKTDINPKTGQLETMDVISNEYAMQRPSVEWLAGMMDMMHMIDPSFEMIIPPESTILKKNGTYGFEDYLREDIYRKWKLDLETQLGFYTQNINGLQNQMQNEQQMFNQKMAEYNQKLAVMTGGKSAVELRLADFND